MNGKWYIDVGNLLKIRILKQDAKVSTLGGTLSNHQFILLNIKTETLKHPKPIKMGLLFRFHIKDKNDHVDKLLSN